MATPGTTGVTPSAISEVLVQI